MHVQSLTLVLVGGPAVQRPVLSIMVARVVY